MYFLWIFHKQLFNLLHLVIFVGVFEIANKNLSVGGLIAVTILASRAMVPVIQVSMTVIKLKEIKESLNNINDFGIYH